MGTFAICIQEKTGCAAEIRRAHTKSRDSRRDMLEPQKECFVRDVLKFSQCVATKSTLSCEFFHELRNLRPQNRCFVQGFRQFSSHLTKCHACQGIRTLSPFDAALTLRFAKRNATRHVWRREMMMQVSKVSHLPGRMELIVWKRRKRIPLATHPDRPIDP